MRQLQNELLNIGEAARYCLSQKDHNIVTEKTVPNYSYTNVHKDEIVETNPGDS